MSLLLVLSVIFATIFNQVRTSSEGGGQRIEMRGIHRQTQRRLTLLLRGAMAPTEVDPAIVVPEYGETEAQVRFHAPVNLLEPALPFVPRTPDYPEFTLALDPGTGSLFAQRSDLSGLRQQIGRGFDSVLFEREHKHSLVVVLTSEADVRGAAGGRKAVTETSRNLIRLPGIR